MSRIFLHQNPTNNFPIFSKIFEKFFRNFFFFFFIYFSYLLRLSFPAMVTGDLLWWSIRLHNLEEVLEPIIMAPSDSWNTRQKWPKWLIFKLAPTTLLHFPAMLKTHLILPQINPNFPELTLLDYLIIPLSPINFKPWKCVFKWPLESYLNFQSDVYSMRFRLFKLRRNFKVWGTYTCLNRVWYWVRDG